MKMTLNRVIACALVASAVGIPPVSAQVLSGQPQPNFINLLDNGTFNTYQRSTTAASSISNTATYHADRWAGYGGASSSITLTNVTSGVPLPFTNAERLQRAASNANTAKVCIGQEIPTEVVTPLAGQQVVLSWWAKADANFSAASSTMLAQVGTGTGTDEGLATFISGFAGAATPVNASQVITTSWQRYAAIGTLSATATEAVAQFCFTPVGTAGTTDGIEITGAQLERGNVPSNFEWRSLAAEFPRLVRYGFYRLSEPATGAAVSGFCQATGASTNACTVYLPYVMRATTPTITITAAGTFKANIAGTPTTVATPTAGVCSSTSCTVTAGNTNTAGQAEQLTGGGGTGKWDISGDF